MAEWGMSPSVNPATLAEDFGSSGASPSLTLTDTTASAEDYTLLADADKLTISSSQGVGGAEVKVDGNLTLNHATSPELKFTLSDTATGSIFAASDGIYLDAASGDSLFFRTNQGFSRMNIASGGNIALGNGTAEEKVHIFGGALALENTREIRWDDNGGTLRTLLAFDASNVFQVGHSSFNTNLAGAATTVAGTEIILSNASVRGITNQAAGAEGFFLDSAVNNNKPFIRANQQIELRTYDGSAYVDKLHVETGATGGVVINETGLAADFRVEGDTNANLLFVDASADKVGIGTSGPGEMLEVNGGHLNVFYGDNNPKIKIGDSASSGDFALIQWNSTADELRIGTDTGGAQLYLAETGRVGVGVTAPATKLHVVDGTAVQKFGTVTLADDASLALETSYGSQGILTIVGSGNEAFGSFAIRGSENISSELTDAGGKLLNTDTDGSVCVFPDLDGTYTLRNRVGTQATFSIQYIGF